MKILIPIFAFVTVILVAYLCANAVINLYRFCYSHYYHKSPDGLSTFIVGTAGCYVILKYILHEVKAENRRRGKNP